MPKPRLKAVVRSNDNWLHCCRYCHYYENGKCYKQNIITSGEELRVYAVAENGYLAQTLEETLNNEELLKGFMFGVESILDKWNISQKRKKEFEEHFRQEWSEFADFQLKEELDEQVSECYQNHLSDVDVDEGIEISDPENFCCKEWC